MRRKLAAGNWKMNGARAALAEVEALLGLHPAPGVEVLLCPPATLIAALAEMRDRHPLAVGAQDCHPEAAGAHTGDLSATLLADAGATHVILGHSERRAGHGETDEDVRAKALAARAAGLTAIICVGETLADREGGRTLDVVGAQADASVPEGATGEDTVLAYEPVWAIGTGLTPTLEQIAEVHDFLRSRLSARLGTEGAQVRLLYGGSVKPANAAAIFAVPDVDGALVGGASLKAADFSPIIAALEEVARQTSPSLEAALMERLAQSPTGEAFVQDPYPFYDRARAGGDLFWWEDYDLACATSHRAVTALLRDRRLGREAPEPERHAAHVQPFYDLEAHSMLELEPPRHTRLRGGVLRAFTSRRIAALGPEVEALCDRLIDAFPAGPFDLLDSYARVVPVVVIARLLGVPEERAPDLLGWSNAMVAMYQARRTRVVEDAAVAATLAFRAFVSETVADRRRALGDDLLSHLAAGGDLSQDELAATAILLLNAGHEATVHTIGNGLRALLAHGRPPVTEACVEEVLRWDPPLHMFTRWGLRGVRPLRPPLSARRPGRLPPRRRQPGPRHLRGPRPLRPRAPGPCQRGLRRRHPLLRGRAAGAAGTPRRAGAAPRAAPRPAARRGAALRRRVPLPRPRAADGRGLDRQRRRGFDLLHAEERGHRVDAHLRD
jgi:triosephosphate isomerase